MKIDELLDTMGEEIDQLSRKAFERVMALVNEGVAPQKAISEALSGFNGVYYAMVSAGLGEILKASISSEYIKDLRVSDMALSDVLYNHQKTVTAQAKQIINDHLKEGGTVRALATKLYEGYNFKDDPLKIKKGLPKYLIKEVDALSLKMANKLRTPALKASYLELLNAKSKAQYENRLKQAVYERNRYYANRIAQTETFRAYSEAEARLHMADDELTTVKIMMSASHPTADICDYHSGVDLYGLGKGVYPKAKAPLPPYHPHCRCRILSRHSIDSTGAKLNPNAPKEFVEKFPLHVQNRIIGSNAKLERFKVGEDIEKILNDGVSDSYRLKFVGGVGYNAGMKKTFDQTHINFTTNWTEQAGVFYDTKRAIYRNGGMDGTLEDMFAKYGGTYPKNKPLYRGLKFDTYERFSMILANIEASKSSNSLFSMDEAPSSFSKAIHIAKDFGKFGNPDYFTILLVAKSRITDDLDISHYSLKPYQQEVIIPTHKTSYEILSIDKDTKGNNWIISLKEVVDA